MSKYEIIISIFFLRASRSCSHAQKTAGNALCTAAPMQEVVRLVLTVPLAAAAIAVAMKCPSSAAAAVPKQQTATFQTTSTSFAAVIAARVSHSSWAADPESQTTAATVRQQVQSCSPAARRAHQASPAATAPDVALAGPARLVGLGSLFFTFRQVQNPC